MNCQFRPLIDMVCNWEAMLTAQVGTWFKRLACKGILNAVADAARATR